MSRRTSCIAEWQPQDGRTAGQPGRFGCYLHNITPVGSGTRCQHHPETVAIMIIRRRVIADAGGGSAKGRVIEPTAAAQHTKCSGGRAVRIGLAAARMKI